MYKNSTRFTAVVGTTLALAIAGTAAVAAAGPRDREDARGFGGWGMAGMGPMDDGPRMGGMRIGVGLRGLDADVERAQRTVQTVDGTTVTRVEQGVVEAADASSLSFTLASGEEVTVVIDDDTDAMAYEEQEVTSRRGWTRTRLAPTEVELTDIEAGAEVVVWSEAEDDAAFVASRIVIRPDEATDEDSAVTEDAEAAETADA